MYRLNIIIVCVLLFSCNSSDTIITNKDAEKVVPENLHIDKYVSSKDGKHTVTIMYIDGLVSFINGKDTSQVRKNGYIRAIHGMDNIYDLYVRWEEDSCIILSFYEDLQIIGNPKKIGFKELRGTGFYDDVRKDKSNINCTGDIYE